MVLDAKSGLSLSSVKGLDRHRRHAGKWHLCCFLGREENYSEIKEVESVLTEYPKDTPFRVSCDAGGEILGVALATGPFEVPDNHRT